MPLTISVVTPSFQHAAYIEQTIRSVLEQDYAPIEYLVMDGGSTDETVDILRRYGDRLTWSSEPDHGQADAINKGFRRATGDIFAWVNSDDYYAPGALRAVATYFEDHPDASFVYGDAVGVDLQTRSYGVRLHVRQRQQYSESDLDVLVGRYDFMVQPACFWRASLWHTTGELDVRLRYAMDYDYWMRIAEHYPLHYLPVTLAYERLYAQAKTGSGNIARIEEIEQVARRHGGSGLPSHYQSEAAAHYFMHGLKLLIRGHFDTARSDFYKVRRHNLSTVKFLGYLGVMLLLGEQAIPVVWLWLNRWRVWRSGPSASISRGSARH